EFPIFTVDQRRIEILLNATPRCNVKGEVLDPDSTLLPGLSVQNFVLFVQTESGWRDEAIGVLGVGQDITERKKVEIEKANTFIDTANAPIFGIDHNGMVNEWNNKSVEITGYSKEEVLGQNLVNVYISEDFCESVWSVLDSALHGQAAANFEFPIFTKDRRRIEILLNATPRCNVKGEVIGVLGVGQDITERKMIEVEKATVAQELQTFIDTANAPIFGIDQNGMVNEWNNKSVEITGYTREEVLGQSLVNVYISEDFRESVKSVLDDALNGQGTANFEFPIFTVDQRRIEILLNATTRCNVKGEVL
ncbi:PAS domain-containing protein, partial [Baffinella frigidus]